MALIQVSGLTFSYEGSYDLIYENAGFQIDTDWKLGFVGRNGRGKTTLLRLLTGELEYSGTIRADTEFTYFPFPVKRPWEDALTAVQDASPDLEYWRLARELSRLQIDEGALYRPFQTLSGGERTKVMLAALFSRECQFLLIDEPTNHLDAEGRRLVGGYLAGKKGFLLVSHDRAFLDRSVDHILAVEKTKITVTRGNFSVWYENKERRDQFEREENERLCRDIRRLKESARQAGAWADQVESGKLGKKAAKKEAATGSKDGRDYVGEKSRRMQMRRKNLERRQQRAVEEKEGLLHDVENIEELKLFPGIGRRDPQKPILRIRDLALRFGEAPPVFSGFQLELRPGEQVLLTGKNGCGKTSILKRIAMERGLLSRDPGQGNENGYTGELWLDGSVKLSYVPQDTCFLRGRFREYAEQVCEAEKIPESLFFALLRKLDMKREQFDKRLEEFSEGQKKKVLLAQSLCAQADLYLWDEPLNYIDFFTRIQLERLITAKRPTMLLIEHDERFSQTIAGREAKVYTE